MTIEKIDVFRYSLPLSKPLALSSYCLTTREVLLLRGESVAGECWAEVSPLPGYSRESLDDCLAQLQIFFSEVPPRKLTPQCFDRQLHNLLPSVSWALASLFFSEQNIDTVRLCPLVVGDLHDISPHISADIPPETSVLEENQSPAIPSSVTPPFVIKLKVGAVPIEKDIARINHLLALAHFSGQLRLDANQRWTYSDLLAVKNNVDTARIQWFEDPLHPRQNYADWSRFVDLPFAYDETLYAGQTSDIAKLQNLTAFIIKPSLLGFNETLRLIQQARDWQCNAVISSSFESPLGIKKLAAFAKKHAPYEYHGLDTIQYFEEAFRVDARIDVRPNEAQSKLVQSKFILLKVAEFQ